MTAISLDSAVDQPGLVQLSISYDALSFTLTLAIHRAVGLTPVADSESLLDIPTTTGILSLPCVRVTLLPDGRSHVIAAKTFAGSSTPEWNEEFAFDG